MTYSFSATPFKFLVVLIFRNRKSILKFIWNLKGLQIAKIILRKNNRTEDLMLPDIKIYNKVIVIKTVWCWHKDRHRHQWSRYRIKETRTYKVNRFLIEAQVIQWGKLSNLLKVRELECKRARIQIPAGLPLSLFPSLSHHVVLV